MGGGGRKGIFYLLSTMKNKIFVGLYSGVSLLTTKLWKHILQINTQHFIILVHNSVRDAHLQDGEEGGGGVVVAVVEQTSRRQRRRKMRFWRWVAMDPSLQMRRSWGTAIWFLLPNMRLWAYSKALLLEMLLRPAVFWRRRNDGWWELLATAAAVAAASFPTFSSLSSSSSSSSSSLKT